MDIEHRCGATNRTTEEAPGEIMDEGRSITFLFSEKEDGDDDEAVTVRNNNNDSDIDNDNNNERWHESPPPPPPPSRTRFTHRWRVHGTIRPWPRSSMTRVSFLKWW